MRNWIGKRDQEKPVTGGNRRAESELIRSQEELARQPTENVRWTFRLTVIAIFGGMPSSLVTLTEWLREPVASQEAGG